MDSWILKLINDNNGNVGALLYVLIVMFAAAVCSFLIGAERQLLGKSAGIRTHAILSMGCALLMVISIWSIRIADGSEYDTSRIAAGAVTGMGFLGGGVIIKDKVSVKGLSTASTLWICSAIGLACGAGFVVEALAASILTCILLFIFNKIINYINYKSPALIIKSNSNVSIITDVIAFNEKNGLFLKNITIVEIDDKTQTIRFSYAHTTNKVMLEYAKNHLLLQQDISEINIINVKNK